MVGAGGVLGHEIAEGLRTAGSDVTRTARRDVPGLRHHKLDLTDEVRVRQMARGHDASVLVPILTVSAPAARWMAEEGVRRIVVFSSNNVGIDQHSPVYAALREAEAEVAAIGAEVVILRPTMIYGYAGDGNLSKLMRFAYRRGFLPCPGDGRALQQPVFVEDVAAAAVLAARGAYAPGPFSVGGPDVLPQTAVFSEVLRAVGGQGERVVKLPLAPVKLAARLGEALGMPLPLSTVQLRRMTQDKTATEPQPFGFIPRVSLQEGLERLNADLAARGSEG